MLTIQWSDLHRLNFKCPSFICPPTVHIIKHIFLQSFDLNLILYSSNTQKTEKRYFLY
jgi:hypothetical protein